MARIHLIVKYTFFVVLVFSAGLAIERLMGVKRWWKVDSYEADDLIYNASSPMMSKNFDAILSKRYLKCLTEPSKPFCLLSANKRLEVFRSEEQELPNVEEIENRLQNITSDLQSSRRRMHSLLVAFTRLMKGNNVKAILIEPSMLFCLMSSAKKFSMLTRGFNPGRLQGSRNVVTIGVLSEDSKKLEENNLTSEMFSVGFKIIKFRKWTEVESKKSFETVHYFFILQDVAVHTVIFYPRDTYLWHAGLDPKEIDFEGLLFVNEEIFENFTLFPLNLAGTSMRDMFLPHDIRYFMTEIESSEIVECTTNSSGIIIHTKHPNLTKEQLNIRAAIALKELKTVFAPYIAFFWLWSKTLLGWFAECDIFYYSTDLDLALTFKSIQGLNLSELLADNEFLKIADSDESDSKFNCKLDCHGLLVNLYIIHEDKDLFWYRHGEDDAYKAPVFRLCSSQIFGQKIHVPCNTTDVLKSEYAQNGTNKDSSFFNFLSKVNLSISNETGD